MRMLFEKYWKKYKEFILYCVFGVGTFLVDVGMTFLLDSIFVVGDNFWILHSITIFSTLSAITFAYVTNRYFVFENHAIGTKAVVKEALSFYTARIFTLILSEVFIEITVRHMGLDVVWMKICINVIVIILNYLFSKLWIFKPSKPEE